MPAGVYVIAVVAWLYFVSLDMLATGLPLALAAAGAGEGWIGFLVGWMGLAAMLQRPFLAAWGDRRGHGRLLVLSLLAGLAGALLFASSPHPAAQLLARTLQGTSLAGLVVSTQALMAALAPPALRARALALQGLADTGGVLAGTNLGEWAWRHLGRTGLFAGTAAVVAGALLLATALRTSRPAPGSSPVAGSSAAGAPAGRAARGTAAAAPARPVTPRAAAASPVKAFARGPADPRAPGRSQAPGPSPRLPAGHREPGRTRAWRTRLGPAHLPVPAPLLGLATLTGTIFGAALNLTVLHAQAVGFRAGAWLAVFALVAMGARYAAGTLIDRGAAATSAPEPGEDSAGSSGSGVALAARLLGPAFGLMAAGEAVLAAAQSGTAAYAAAVILAAGYGVAHTALVAAAVGGAPAARRGIVAGWLANAIDLGVGAGLAVLGWILEAWSFPVMYGVLAGAGALGVAVSLAGVPVRHERRLRTHP